MTRIAIAVSRHAESNDTGEPSLAAAVASAARSHAASSVLDVGLRREQILADALREQSADVHVLDWELADVDWSAFDVVLVRATWSYCLRPATFLRWAQQVSEKTLLINPVALLDWNHHKRYLGDLAARGVPVVPSRFLSARSGQTVSPVMAAAGWTEAVIKPAVDIGGMGARRLRRDAAGERSAEQLLSRSDAVLQPFAADVLTCGETLLVYVDGSYSHAIRRRGADGEFRTHEIHGGAATPVTPTRSQRQLGRRALQAVPGNPLIARVDMVTMDGTDLVSEVELIEPCLYPEFAPHLGEAVAAATLRRAAHRPLAQRQRRDAPVT